MKKTAIFATLLCLAQSSLHADVPSFINYQGKVADATGLPIGASGTAASFTAAPVNRKILFRIYSTATGGTPLWTEEQTATVSSGVFSVLLGNGIPATGLAAGGGGTTLTAEQAAHTDLSAVFANSASRFLEIVVDSGDNALTAADVPVSPRQQITSTAFAFRAKVADGIAPATATSTDLTISPSTLPTGIAASNYGLGWYGSGRTFNGIAVDGPVLYGNAGGALGSNTGSVKNLALAWNAAGQVGIGTPALNAINTNLTNKLILQGDDATTPAQQLVIRGNTDPTERLAIGYDTTLNQGTLQSYTAASSYGNLVLNPLGGNIGIGTSAPTNRLSVEYARQSTASSANAAAKIGGTNIYTYMGSYNNGSYATWIQSMRSIDDVAFPLAINPNGGNVGIGTTAPASKLDVNGSAHVATTLTVDGAASAASFTGNGAALTALAGANLSSGTVPLAALVDAVKLALCPAGSIMAYGGTTAPTGWLLCDGTSYSRTTYLTLFTAIGTSFGAVPDNFNVPDLRGRFLRGTDNGATHDPDRASRTAITTGGNIGDTIGSLQLDAFKSHVHALPSDSVPGATGDMPTVNNTAGSDEAISAANPTGSTGGTETRPVNVNVNYIIKY